MFKELKELLQQNFKNLSEGSVYLFETEVDKDYLWNLYLDSFPEGANEFYRERREYDCQCCRQFIRNIGNVVKIKGGKIKTIWDFESYSEKYQPVLNALDSYIKSLPVKDVFITKEKSFGINSNYEKKENGDVRRWHHFYLDLPINLISKSYKSVDTVKGDMRSTKNVFLRSLSEIKEDSIQTVLELIGQNSLYKGEEWKGALQSFLEYKLEFKQLPDDKKELYAWETSTNLNQAVARIRNHSMGTLLVDLSENVDLDTAVRKYEKIVAPENYKRPKAIYTKRMIEEAQKTVAQLGYMESLDRRYANLEDISVNNILFSNRDIAKQLKSENVFEELSENTGVNPKQFSKVEEVSVDKFLVDILPSAKELEVLLENKHSSNLVSLIAPKNKESKTMFKWSNSFGWAYSGNITDSSMKENVKNAGGKIDGVLRFSIQWNEYDEYNKNDFDAHCIEPFGNEIYYSNKKNHTTTGMLDVDIISPIRNKAAVENITWSDKEKMREGDYLFFVNNFTNRGGKDGFRAEIEFDGQTYSFECNRPVKHKEKVKVATVSYSKKDGFTIKEHLNSNVSSKELWGLQTNNFVPASVVMHSPNYWDNQKGIGHKHYFFMLKGCINEQSPNGFFNEFLKEELNEHKRVFEALGSKMSVEETENQLSGLGFSSTKRAELVVRVKGHTDRVLKVKF